MEVQKTTLLYDYSILEKIKPYDGDQKILLSDIDIDKEILMLSQEIQSIDIRSIPWDKWDYIIAFSLAMMEVSANFFISDPAHKSSLASKLSDKNSKLGSYLQQYHEKWDHGMQPLDYQGPGFGGGSHRGKTFGHDLLMFPLSLYMLYTGQFIDGTFTKEGVYNWIVSNTNQHGTLYAGLNASESIIAYFTHMAADFCSAYSLPIPGFSFLTHFPNRDVQAFAMRLYRNGLNVRNLLLQGVPIAITELVMWLYTELKYKDSNYSEEAIRNKREKLLLISHGIATAVNIGKVIITKNPVSLNLIMILRTVKLVWNIVRDEINLTHKAIVKANVGVLKNQYEMLNTLILLDEAIYYTEQMDRLLIELTIDFTKTNELRKSDINEGLNELDQLLLELRSLNSGVIDHG